MPLRNLTASPHPCGYRIDIRWSNPDDALYPGMRIVRRDSRFPLAPDDGDIVLDDPAPPLTPGDTGAPVHAYADDDRLHGETTYYYALFPFDPTTPGVYLVDEKNRTAALATSSYGIGEQLYELLPKIYHRYDDALSSTPPEGLAPEDDDKGPLQRLFEIVGSQLDLIQSHAKAIENLHDLSRIDGRLLHLLAAWTGWQTNYRLDFDSQRRELRHAPAIYETVGIVPTTEATVKRLLGWESRTKSFADNVFMTNQPERLNLVHQRRGADGVWRTPSESVSAAAAGSSGIPGINGLPFSLHFGYEGRSSAAVESDGQTVWLFFHTLRKQSVLTSSKDDDARYGRWDLWYKRYAGGEWQPSQPFTDDGALDRHPTLVRHLGRLWLFWDRWDERSRRWRLIFSIQGPRGWGTHETLWPEPTGIVGPDRKHPYALVDDNGGMWLFWLRRAGGAWRIEYNRHDGTSWVLPNASPGVVPNGLPDERVSDGPISVLFHPTDAGRRLWLFWQRRIDLASGQYRRRIAWRTKASIDPNAADWSATQALPAARPEADDIEPALLLGTGGAIELFWSSNQDRSFSVWHDTLDTGTDSWGGAQSVTTNPFSQRGPSVVRIAGETWLFYGSNESLSYQSDSYRATTTLDTRYAGSTTLHADNAAKLAFLSEIDSNTSERRGGDYEDFNTYSYDTGEDGERANRHWYAQDTVGLYLTPTSDDPSVIVRDRRRIEEVLRQFLPIQLRTVLIIEPPPYVEKVYTYDFPDDEQQITIGEVAYDSTLPETYPGANDAYEDTAPDWVWMVSWSPTTADHRTVDFATLPADTSARTWHIAVTPGGGS